MSIFDRILYHILYNGLRTQSQGAKVARQAVKRAGLDHPVAEIGALAAGAFVGSFLGGIKMLSPAAIIDSATKSEEEMDESVKNIGPWGGLE